MELSLSKPFLNGTKTALSPLEVLPGERDALERWVREVKVPSSARLELLLEDELIPCW